MILQIDETYRITVDSSNQNWQLERLESIIDKKTREIVRSEYKIIGYHGSSIKSVLNQYKREALISDDSISSFDEVLIKLDKIDKTIDKVVKRENITLDNADD